MNLDKRLLQYLLRLRVPFLLAILAGLATSVAVILQADVLSRAIDRAFLKSPAFAQAVPLLGAFLALAMLRFVCQWGGQVSAKQVASRVKADLRSRLSTHLLKLGPAYTQSQQTGELKNTFLKGVDALDVYFSDYVPQLLLAVLIPLLILLFVFPVDLLSGFVFLFTAPLIPFFMILIGDVAQGLTRKQWKSLSRLSAMFLDTLQGLTTLKILGRSKDQVQRIKTITDEFRHTTVKVLRVAFLSALVLELVATLSTAIIAVEIGLRLLYDKMQFQQALFILILAPEFYQPLRQLGQRFHAGMEGFTAATRIFEILEQPPTVQTNGSNNLPWPAPLLFQNVTFRYSGAEGNALKQVNMRVLPGQHIALVGPSGAGKTTFTFLLMRFLDPTSGDIRVGDGRLADLDIEQWRQHIAWVPQQPFLFHKSVAENLALARENATPAEIQSAAKRAYVHDLFRSLPNGYNTLIGERGTRLSGGQAQRLALARAFLKDAPILIFDEPTAQLDAETEEHIQSSMADLSQQRTVITIAHRLHTIETADIIFVMQEGKIIDSGSHLELKSRSSLYRQLLGSGEVLS